ncbi:MAG: exodeoxyribonuclease III [Armatimonadetes bacterium]|nr:exodeoxyribonuclease III [Armatimonadota bacterium]
MKVATFNVNGIRARLDIVLDWLGENEPDVLAIQESKCEDGSFPMEAFEDAGWQVAIHGQKGFNGVALISRQPILNVSTGFGDPLWPEDCRIIQGQVGPLTILNTYVPNGTQVGSEKFDYKLRWMERFRSLVASRFSAGSPVVWLGDINVAPTSDDLFDPEKHRGKVGFSQVEIDALKANTDWGWNDLFRKFESGPGHHTFWEFVIPKAFERNLGWRIDHIYAPADLAARCVSCRIDKHPRGLERPSDHTPVVAEFEV